jgi:hypothetical protein
LRKATLLLFLAFNLILPKIFAQDYPKQNIDFQAFIQNIIGIPSDNLNYDELLESLGQLYINPIDLNKANYAQLASLFLLNDVQIKNILNHRNQTGEFTSIYELQAIEGIEMDLIYKIIPFITVKQPALSINSVENSVSKANQTFILRSTNILEQKKGYTPLKGKETVRYLGTQGGLYMRYKLFHAKDISLGFTLEKDDGETYKLNPKKQQYLFDFSSVHFQVQNKGHWKNITLGDYTMQFGQGLVLSSGFYLGKGAETILSVRRNSLGIRPYTSVIESNFFRGVGATYQLGQFEFTSFFARNKRTANLVINKNTKEKTVSSIDADGYHRTQSELDDKAILVEQNLGFNAHWQNKANNFQLEFTGLKTDYSLPLLKADKPYNKYEFKGNQQQIGSLSYSYIVNNLNFFGETAKSKSGGIGTVNGLLISTSKKTDLSFVYRNYAKNFHSFYANSFGENSRNINENGAYIGFKYSPNRRWISTSSFDYFRFPELKFGVDGPSKGLEFLQRITHSPTKTTHWNIQYREQHKEQNLKVEKINVVTNTIKRNIILDFETAISNRISLKSRLMGSNFHFAKQAKTKGFAIVQDARLELNKINFNARLAYYNTDDYDNRQYVYEQDVLYAFSFPAYYNKGLRTYLLMTYKPIKATEIQIRWARTELLNKTTIGSGLEEIAKPHKTELKIQLKWNW